MPGTRTLDVPAIERGLPYSVTYYDHRGGQLHRGRVYLLNVLQDPFGWQLLDAVSGETIILHFSSDLPAFGGPTVGPRYLIEQEERRRNLTLSRPWRAGDADVLRKLRP